MGSNIDRRISRRVCLNPYMKATLTHVNAIDVVPEDVCIKDVGFTGVKFQSSTQITLGEEIILSAQINGSKDDMLVQGPVVHRKAIENGAYEYGLEFYLNDEETEIWAHALEIILHETDTANGRFPYTPHVN